MTSYRPIDSKREEFRKYLERAGVMDALTKALVCLYEEVEKPVDALAYVRKALGDTSPDEAEVQAMKAELEEAKTQVQSLTDENKMLKDKLKQYEPEEGEGATEDKPEDETAKPGAD